MARLNSPSRRGLAVAVATLVATTAPSAVPAVAQAASGATAAVAFYTPVEGDTVRVDSSRQVHLVLGAAGGVDSIQLAYKRPTDSRWSNLGEPLTPSDSGVVDTTWTAGLTGDVDLQATGNDPLTGDQVIATAHVTLAPTAGTSFGFIRPRTENGHVVPLGVFKRVDGRLFARTSGTTTADQPPTGDDPAADPSVPLPATTLPDPTGTFDAENGVFREPVDLSRHTWTVDGDGVPVIDGARAVIRVHDGVSSAAVEAPLYLQKVASVTVSSAPVSPASSNVTVTASATDRQGQPVVGAPVRLTGYVNGSRTPVSQLGITNGSGQVTFTGAGTGTGPTAATGYPAGFYTAYADLDANNVKTRGEAGSAAVTVGTVTRTAPGKSLYHDNTPTRGAGGTVGDSLSGTRLAAAGRYQWIDQNGQLSFTTRAALRAGAARISQPGQLTWVNAHGAPFNPRWLGKGRFETRAWARIKRRPGLRNADLTFQQNAARRISVEWEVKDIRPFTTPAALDAAFTSLAASAQRCYGPAWRSRVQVKMLSNLSGGQAFALKVLQVAHAKGFTTIYLARGNATQVQIPAAAHQYVDYVRGARAGLYAPAG